MLTPMVEEKGQGVQLFICIYVYVLFICICTLLEIIAIARELEVVYSCVSLVCSLKGKSTVIVCLC